MNRNSRNSARSVLQMMNNTNWSKFLNYDCAMSLIILYLMNSFYMLLSCSLKLVLYVDGSSTAAVCVVITDPSKQKKKKMFKNCIGC